MKYYRPFAGMYMLLVGIAACVICIDGAYGSALSPVSSASFHSTFIELRKWDAGRRLAQAPVAAEPADETPDDGTVVTDPTDTTDGEITAPTDATDGEVTDPTDGTGGEVTDPTDGTGGEVTDPTDGEVTDPTDGEVTDPTDGEVTDPTDGTGGEVTDPTDGTGGEVTDPTDPNTGGEVVDPTDPNTGGGVTDPNTGGEVVDPTDPNTGGGVTDPNTGGEVVDPTDPNTGGGVTDPNTGGEVVDPTDPNTGGGVTDPNTGGEVVDPTDPNTGGGVTDPNTGGEVVDPTDPTTGEEVLPPNTGEQDTGDQAEDPVEDSAAPAPTAGDNENDVPWSVVGGGAAGLLILILLGIICARCCCSKSKKPQQYQQQPYPGGYTEQYPLQQQWQGKVPMYQQHPGSHQGSPYSSQGNMAPMAYSHDGTKLSYSHDGYHPGFTQPHLSNGDMSSVHSGMHGSVASGTHGMPPGAYASSMGGSLVNTRASNTMSSASGNTEVNQLRHTMVTAINTVNGGDVRGRLENALDNFAQAQKPFLDRYVMLSAAHRRQGGQGVVQFARGVHDGEEYAIKFFTHRPAFLVEFELYQNPVLRNMMPAVTQIEANEDGRIASLSGWPMPPCIVIERGESLDKWALRIKPDFTTILQVLTHVCTRLQLLHDSGLAHRDLKPGNILWRPQHLQWTLIDFGCAAEIGARFSPEQQLPNGKPAPVSLSLKYAAPEVVQAYEASEQTIVVDASMDMWALGIMAFELLTQEPVFPPYTSASDVCDQVAGRKPLPWEAPDADDKLKKLRMLRRSLVKCLSRIPSERPTSKELLASWNRLFDVVGDRTMAG